jgi:flagellar protein FliS
MNTQTYAQRYQAAEVTAVDSKRLLLLVFEGGEKFLQLAREALGSGDVARFADNLSRAQAVIAELMGTLDYKQGGELAINLARLYEFMLFHLTEANAQKSVRHLDDVLRVFRTVAEAFRQILTEPAGKNAAGAATA